MVPFKVGVNPLAHVITGDEDGLVVRGDVLRKELAAWDGEWEPPVWVGWRPGFRDDLREDFEKVCPQEIADGTVVVDHP